MPKLDPGSDRDIRWHKDTTITNTLQAADRNFLAFPESTHFPVATFHKNNVIPLILTFAIKITNVGKAGHAVFEQHAFFQAIDHILINVTTYSYGVFAVDTTRRVHQLIRQFTVGGKKQQTAGINVQTADINPTLILCFRQMIKNGRSTFRVITGTDFTNGFVVGDHTGINPGFFNRYRTAINADIIVATRSVSELGPLTIHRYTTVCYPAFGFTTGSDTCQRQ